MASTQSHTHALGSAPRRPHASRSQVQPEVRLLLACAHANLSIDEEFTIKDVVAHGLDWRVFHGLSQAHGLGYFVSRHLQQIFRDTHLGSIQPSLLPDSVRDLLRREAWQRAVYARILFDCQLRLARDFDDCGIAVLWLKGLALSEKLYGCPEARNSGDLDPLVEPGKVAQAENCLRRCGFERLHSPAHDLHTLGAHHSRWRAEARGVPAPHVELHWRLAGPRACVPDVVGMMHRSGTAVLGDCRIRVLSPEDELLALCLHGHHHNFACLRYLMDVMEYVRRFQRTLDWGQFAALTAAHRCQGRVAAALSVGCAALGSPWDGIAPACLPPLSPSQRWLVRRLDVDALVNAGGDDSDGRRAILGLFMDRWLDAVRLLGPHLFPSRGYVRARYPARWACLPGLRHALHLSQLAWRFGGRVIARIRSARVSNPDSARR